MSIKLGDLELFTVEELSERLGIQERTIREYLKSGKLKGRKMARRWYISAENLRKFFAAEEASADQEKSDG